MLNKRKASDLAAFCLGIGLIAVLIQAGGAFYGNRIVFPSVSEIGKAFVRLLSDGTTYRHIGITFVHLIEALALAMLAGLLTGIAEGLSDFIRTALKPVMHMIRSLPMIILVILLMTVLPYREVPLAAGTVVLIPLISESVSEGIRSIDREMTDVYRINSNLNLSVLTHVHIPLISGYLKQAFFNAAGMGLKIVVSAEYLVQAKDSLGRAVYASSYMLEYAEIYAYAIIMILLVLIVTEIPAAILRTMEKLNADQSPEDKSSS